MKKLLALVLTAVLCLCCLASCTLFAKYSITYADKETERLLHDGYVPRRANPGDTVILRAGPIMDADLYFYANGVQIENTYNDSYYWEYTFIMPDEDVVITHEMSDGFLAKECLNHIDANKDGICDDCGYVMPEHKHTDKVQTTIGEEASLPQFMSLEADKHNALSNGSAINIDVYMGYDILNKDGVAFSDIIVPESDFAEYTFVLEINYNNETRTVALDSLNYFEEYRCNIYQDVVQYSKYNTVQLDTTKMTGKSYGFVNVELYMISNTNERYYVSAETLYYSVTDTEIVFGLVSNPVATEGDPGIITNDWVYQETTH